MSPDVVFIVNPGASYMTDAFFELLKALQEAKVIKYVSLEADHDKEYYIVQSILEKK